MNTTLRVAHRFKLHTAATLGRHGRFYETWFYGYDDGSWEDVGHAISKAGYDWECTPGMSAKNEYRNVSVEGATETHAGFRKALRQIVAKFPEMLDFLISFDGPAKPIRDVLGIEDSFNWGSIKFYHGTSMKAWESIQREGLRPRSDTNVNPVYGMGSSHEPGKREAIYLTTQEGTCHFAALEAGRDKSSPVVLEVTGLDGDSMAADEDSRETDPRKSLDRLGCVAYMGPIPASNIRLHAVYENRRWEKP